MQVMEMRLMSAKMQSLEGAWSEAEVSATRAVKAAMLGPDGQQLMEQLPVLAEVAGYREAVPSQGGFVAHRDVLDAFLCRARARLKLGDGTGARADAATACAMAGQLGEREKQESAQSFLLQAEMATEMMKRKAEKDQGAWKTQASVPEEPSTVVQVTWNVDSLPKLSKMPRPEDLNQAMSFHVSVAVRTWYGGALLLVHHLLGGPSNVTLLFADTNEVEEFAHLPRALRYGGNHGGYGVRRTLGKLHQLMSSLSNDEPIWLSTSGNLTSGSATFKSTVWGFPTVGIAHGRRSEHDCSGSFCYGQKRLWANGVPVVTLRRAVDHWLQPHRFRPKSGWDPLRFLLVQRSQKLSRRLVVPTWLAKSWSRALGPRVQIHLWRPEMQKLVEQARRLAGADMLAAVTGQACGLGIFLRRSRVLLEFTPAIDGSYGCRWGWVRPWTSPWLAPPWPMMRDLESPCACIQPACCRSELQGVQVEHGKDLNPTSEVGQIARLGELHHHCVMSLALGVAESTPLQAKRSAEMGLVNRISGLVVLDTITSCTASKTCCHVGKAMASVWEVVGGAEKGGIVVREDVDLKSTELSRLASGALVQQLALQGDFRDRLHFAKLCGIGPNSGWVSIRLRDKVLLRERGEMSKEELENREAAEKDGETNPWVEGLWKWRFGQLSKVEADLVSKAEASSAFLAFHLCMSRFDLAIQVAEQLEDSEVRKLVEEWDAEAQQLTSLFFPCQRAPVKDQWLGNGGYETDGNGKVRILQRDLPLELECGTVLGLRLLLQCEGETPLPSAPVVLMFHGEDQNIDTFCEEENLEPWRNAGVHLLIVDFRGYGFSTGISSHYHLRSDGEHVCNALPDLWMKRAKLPWPWPGGWAIYGNGLGSRVACFLAALKGLEMFNCGLILETAWAGSYAPGAQALPEPPKHTALATMGCNAAGDSRFGSLKLHRCAALLGRKARQLLRAPKTGAPDPAQYAFVRGNEDLIQAFDGAVLILHGEVDHLVPAEHARRLHQAATRASERYLVLAKGKRADSLRSRNEMMRAEASFTWRTAAKVLPPSGAGRLRRVLRQAVYLVRLARINGSNKEPKTSEKKNSREVLLQMGITPLTFDGYAIKSVKLWGLYCRACFYFHRDSSKAFCPKCGNDTVVRVPIIVDQDGVPTVMNSGRKLRTKGTVFSMPKPQGGRVWKPIFAEEPDLNRTMGDCCLG
eukprot:symbB.v1.2.017807.t2/scaffold1391.1/size121936/3